MTVERARTLLALGALVLVVSLAALALVKALRPTSPQEETEKAVA